MAGWARPAAFPRDHPPLPARRGGREPFRPRPKAEVLRLKIKTDPRTGKGQALNLLMAPGIRLLLDPLGEGHIAGATDDDTRSTGRPFREGGGGGTPGVCGGVWGGAPTAGTPPGQAGNGGSSEVTHPESTRGSDSAARPVPQPGTGGREGATVKRAQRAPQPPPPSPRP